MVANKSVSQVLATLKPTLCDGAMLQQIDWAISVLAIEASRLREIRPPDYQPRRG